MRYSRGPAWAQVLLEESLLNIAYIAMPRPIYRGTDHCDGTIKSSWRLTKNGELLAISHLETLHGATGRLPRALDNSIAIHNANNKLPRAMGLER